MNNHTPKFGNVVKNLQKQAVDNTLNSEENDAIKLALEKGKDEELKVDVKEDQKNKKKSAGSMLS